MTSDRGRHRRGGSEKKKQGTMILLRGINKKEWGLICGGVNCGRGIGTRRKEGQDSDDREVMMGKISGAKPGGRRRERQIYEESTEGMNSYERLNTHQQGARGRR